MFLRLKGTARFPSARPALPSIRKSRAGGEQMNAAVAVISESRYRSMAAHLLFSSSNIDDALQITAALAVEFMPSDHPAPGGWLTLTLKRECYRLNCNGKSTRGGATKIEPRDPAEIVAEAVDDPLEIAVAKVEHDRRVTLLDKLKPDERTALLLNGVGYSYLEIASLRGWTYTKVNRCLVEGRQALRGLLGDPEALR